MFSTFHLKALEVKLQTTLGKSTFKSPKTLTSPVATGEGESPDESSALEELPVEVHFPIANSGKLDKLEDQLDNADAFRVLCICHILFKHKQLFEQNSDFLYEHQ